jgi:hypothetical protein
VRNGALGVLALVVLAGADTRAADAKVNTIKKVSVKGGTVEIVGTQKPSFTTFPMSDPPRFVIDISEAVFSGVPEDVTVPGGGRITAIKTASYGNDASAIARVVIGFDRDVEPDVQATGSTLMVKVGAGAPPAVASRATPAPAAAAAPEATAAAASDTGALAQGRALATAATASQAKQDDQSAKDALAKANAKAEADRKAGEAAALAEQQRQAEVAKQREAIAQAETDRKAKAQAEKEARARADQERAAQQKASAEAQARANAERKAQAEADKAAAARAEADRKAQADAAKVAAATAAAQKKQQDDAARAEAKRQAKEEAARAEADRKAQAEAARAEKQRQAQEKAALAEAQRREKATVVAQADTRQAVREASDAPPASESGGAEVSNRRKTVMLVGFSPDKSRVFVRTSEPVHYTVSQADERTIVLELENTSIHRSNDRRPLDTRYFGGPVVEISPRPASGKTVRVSVTLRDKVGYQARQDGNEVSLLFAP